MKKILIISLILGMMLPLTSLAQEGVNIGPVKFQVGLNQFPGKTYWVEVLYKWDAGLGFHAVKAAQKEETCHLSLLSLRVAKMKPILSPNLSGGIEVGCEIPISSWKKKWENAAGDTSVGEPAEFTEMEWEFFWLDEPDVDYTSSLELEEKLLVVPILGKLAYTGGGRMKVGAALAFGAYVINSRITGTMTRTYVQDSTKPWDPWYKEGDEITLESTISTTACSPGGEFSVQLALPVSPTVSVGLNGSVGYIGKAVAFWGQEWTDYEATDWTPPADRELSTYEQRFETGGLSYGGGLSLNLFF